MKFDRVHVSTFFAAVIVFCSAMSSVFADEGTEFFEKKIRPVLVERCYKCHSDQPGGVKGGLRLDSRELARKGGDSGAAVVPGNLDASLLWSAIRYEGLEMPPDGKLTDDTIADFETWIKMGAPDPREGGPTVATPAPTDWNAARQFWSFQPPSRHPLPAVSMSAVSMSTVPNDSWIRQPIDAFILAKLVGAGLEPNGAADRRTLIRRVSFDLTGLPPAAEDVAGFVHDEHPLAYERLVDRLLSSPQYGERWARLWLDIARYAEDQAHIVGNDRSLCYPNAYLYRDWVVAAFNQDMAYDEFVKRQLAADLVSPDDKASHAALGFLGLGPKYYRRNAPEVMADEWEDRVDIVSRGLLGLTVACARCHDHKFDPIPTHDYYALAGVFASTEMFNRPLDDKAELGKNGQAKEVQHAMHIVRDIDVQNLPVHIRGDVKNKGPVVNRRFLQVLSTADAAPFQRGSGRLDLADAIIDRGNPLTARVIVNRIWAQFFGRPLVATPSNFGSLGEKPSHPELLDDLAVRFMDGGWSLKELQRELVLSATYRQSTDSDPRRQGVDPANVLLWRMNRRRLSIEAWRDAVLSIAGQLDLRMGGPSIDPENPAQGRRTVYSEVSRLKLSPLLALFDFPDPNAHSERRSETTTPLQKLFVLNSQFMVRQAESLATRIASISSDDTARITAGYSAVFSRAPTADELRMAHEFLTSCGEGDSTRWVQFAQVLLASNELFMID